MLCSFIRSEIRTRARTRARTRTRAQLSSAVLVIVIALSILRCARRTYAIELHRHPRQHRHDPMQHRFHRSIIPIVDAFRLSMLVPLIEGRGQKTNYQVPINHRYCVTRRVLSYVGVDSSEILDRTPRPFDTHHYGLYRWTLD